MYIYVYIYIYIYVRSLSLSLSLRLPPSFPLPLPLSVSLSLSLSASLPLSLSLSLSLSLPPSRPLSRALSLSFSLLCVCVSAPPQSRSTQTTPRSHFETRQTIWAPTTRIGHTLRRYLQDTPVISGRPGFVKSLLRLTSLAHLLTNVFGCTLFCPHPSVHSFSSCLMF